VTVCNVRLSDAQEPLTGWGLHQRVLASQKPGNHASTESCGCLSVEARSRLRLASHNVKKELPAKRSSNDCGRFRDLCFSASTANSTLHDSKKTSAQTVIHVGEAPPPSPIELRYFRSAHVTYTVYSCVLSLLLSTIHTSRCSCITSNTAILIHLPLGSDWFCFVSLGVVIDALGSVGSIPILPDR
jgi:hypothetical protein